MMSPRRIGTFSNTGLQPRATLSIIMEKRRSAAALQNATPKAFGAVLWRFSITGATLMAEVPDASEDHRHVAFVSCGNHFFVAD